MGGCNSLCIPTKNPNFCRENHASLPKIRGSKRNLSTTFNLNEGVHSPDSLNINTASEEELMTLPGINRATAHNIIEYRKQLGGFKHVEDLALVSGVGATKLESLRTEICITKAKQSKTNSPLGSVNGIELPTVRKPQRPLPQKRTNVNTSNVFQLMKVKGIGLIMAQNIVTYRDKKGSFKSIDDLIKVKGIGPAILSMIRHELCLGDHEDQQSNSADSGIGPSSAQPVPATLSLRSPDSTSTTSDHVNQLVAMCGPLTQSSSRPHITPFNFQTEGRRVVRVASWNLQQLTEDKIDNPGVKEVICMTILENGLGLIAFQEIAKKDALQKICNELNNPTLPTVSKWRGAKGHWEYYVSQSPTGRMFQGVEYNGFLYDTEQEVSLLSASLVDNSPEEDGKAFVRKPFVGHFKLHSVDMALCSVHLKATDLRNEDLDESKQEVSTVPKIAKAVLKKLRNEKDILVLGDFNMSPDCEEFDAFRTNGYTNMIPSNLNTNISTKNMSGSQAYDNIWSSRQLQQIYTGHHGVVREGLTSPWIPDGWSWGGVVSDHCPVWVEYFVDKDLDVGVTRDLEGITLTSAPPVTANEP